MLEIKEDLKNNKDPEMRVLWYPDVAMPLVQVTLTVFSIFYWVIGILTVFGGLWAILELNKYVDLPSEMAGTAPYLMIGHGALMMVVSSLAFSCIQREQTLLLYIYSGCLACVFVINLGLLVSVTCYREALNNGLYDGLMRTIQNYNHETTNFDFAQSTFQCCGVSNYTDWIKSSPTKVIPTSCCIDPTNCVTANYGDVFSKGCYDVIKEYMKQNMPTLLGVSLAVGMMPLFGSLLAYGLAQNSVRGKMYTDAQYAAFFT